MFKCMIAHHNTDNIRKSIMPRSLNQCERTEKSVKCHADESGIRTMNKEIEMSKRTNEILNK